MVSNDCLNILWTCEIHDIFWTFAHVSENVRLPTDFGRRQQCVEKCEMNASRNIFIFLRKLNSDRDARGYESRNRTVVRHAVRYPSTSSSAPAEILNVPGDWSRVRVLRRTAVPHTCTGATGYANRTYLSPSPEETAARKRANDAVVDERLRSEDVKRPDVVHALQQRCPHARFVRFEWKNESCAGETRSYKRPDRYWYDTYAIIVPSPNVCHRRNPRYRARTIGRRPENGSPGAAESFAPLGCSSDGQRCAIATIANGSGTLFRWRSSNSTDDRVCWCPRETRTVCFRDAGHGCRDQPRTDVPTNWSRDRRRIITNRNFRARPRTRAFSHESFNLGFDRISSAPCELLSRDKVHSKVCYSREYELSRAGAP